MIEANAIVGWTFVVYIALMLGIGIYAYKKTQDLSDYILGGRSLGPWPSAISAGASDMSGWLLLGLPGYALAAGMEAFWLAGGLLLGTWLNWLIVAGRLRVYSQVARDSLTLPEFFEQRFRDNSHVLRVISAFFILMFFLFYTSSGLVAGGKLFATVFGMDYFTAVLVGTLAVITYTFFGGFLAVSWTDLVQGLMMAAALVAVPIVLMGEVGGISETFAVMEAKNPELLTLFTGTNGEPLGAIAIISLMAWGLGYFGQPHILARFAAIRSEKDIPAARRIATSWTALTLLGAVFVGFGAIAYLDGGLKDGETVFMVLVNALFHPVVAGILLAAILAAVMSTADSQLLVSSSALTEDFYKSLFRKEASQKELVMVGRIAVIGIAAIALLLARDPDSSVLGLVSYAWAGFGAAFGPALILALFWKRMTRNGALAGIIVGAMTVVIWKQLSGGIFDLYEIVPGFILAWISIYVVSLMGEAPSMEIQNEFDQVVNR
ncbi:sodium/proline symporter [Oceanospirillum multiglobuliferum]|uniref:Sodium/proline symporter n=1 Tax=Oceanospirillum multiglobuliferum TaxID=64969 RepID=A0A1T4MAQ1_9GAMM|nr:sodium/proline symporter PutP [Oceanospirillum multiglobuliferum]OPX56176.1 sodium/proline symporter [Oceanospirillum multiglobuliferum]SJZ63917.1 sodium/proline symporter [Oceanospirillum multiglobuliferum]